MPSMRPKAILNSMMNNFEKASSGLLEVSNRYYEENKSENAIYGVFFGKPSKRLSILLSISREILILFTSFTSQQARTIKTLSKIISENDGRLESTVAIVVHLDPTGNTNLKTWGKENGISILPLFYSEDDYPMQYDQFENLLCREMFSIDPFDVTGPVSDDSQFYGRRTEAQTIARQLQLGQVKSLLGIRKIGKTSILNRIIDTCRTYHRCIVIMTDCSKDVVWELSAEDLLYSICYSLDDLIDRNQNYGVLSARKAETDIGTSSERLTEIISKVDRPVILAFDEFDFITPNSPTNSNWINDFNTFWRNFRSAYQECARIIKPFSILICGVSSKWFRVESINGIENAALTMIPEDYLSPLPRGASIAMIRNMSRVAGLQFPESVADYISEACCDMPYWVRKACSYMHKRIDIQLRPLKVDMEVAQNYINSFINEEGAIIAKVALEHLFRVYPELRHNCKLAFDGHFENISKSYLNILEKYGLLTSTLHSTYFSGAMIREGLSLVFDVQDESVIDESPYEQEQMNSGYEEWADELALIGKRRNILERKLRSIVLNFIRQDSLLNNAKPFAKERILKRIEEKRRKQFENLLPEELMEKLLWPELSTIIEKEWSLFERIFGDKNQFTLNASLINDRFDAHAKSADLADIALYRRALTWFESHINAI